MAAFNIAATCLLLNTLWLPQTLRSFSKSIFGPDTPLLVFTVHATFPGLAPRLLRYAWYVLLCAYSTALAWTVWPSFFCMRVYLDCSEAGMVGQRSRTAITECVLTSSFVAIYLALRSGSKVEVGRTLPSTLSPRFAVDKYASVHLIFTNPTTTWPC